MPKYDIYFQPVPAANVYGYRTFEFGYRAALKACGPPALVNRWVKTFMTLRGSDPLDQTYGTGFSNLIGANISSATVDLLDVVSLAITDANTQVRDQDLKGLYNDDERLANAVLTDFRTSADGIEVWVTITNAAGQAMPVLVATI